MVLKIHGFASSTPTQRVLITLKEKQVPYELIHVDFYNKEQKSEKFLEKQPFGLMPVLEDEDGFLVYESRAICRYIEAKYKDSGTQLIPTDLKELGLFEQGASIEMSYWDPHTSIITFEKVFKALNGLGGADEALVQDKIEKLTGYLDVYEKILSKQEYIGGNSFTLADLFHLTYANFLFHEQIGLSSLINDRPHVKLWWEKISARQSWKDVLSGNI